MLSTGGMSTTGGGLTVTGGSMTVTGTATIGTVTSTSDRRLKRNITKVDDPLNKILKLRGVHFKWKEKYGTNKRPDSQKINYGVLAQEVKLSLKL